MGAAIYLVEPLRPGEKGTVHDAVRAAKSIPTGRPAFTPQRARQYREVPTVREREASERASETKQPGGETEPTGTTTTPVEEQTPAAAVPVEPATTTPADPATTMPVDASTTTEAPVDPLPEEEAVPPADETQTVPPG